MAAPEAGHHEIVIVRRHGDHEEAHHGGVWKIAFADFMTAMMAFFLVMWLISASDKNREAIARYFNPLKLVDTTTKPKGLHDPKKDDASVEQSSNSSEPDAKPTKNEKPSKAEKPEKPAKDEKPPTRSEAKLFQDPYGVLSEIARGAPEDGSKRTGNRSAEGAKGGDSFRDPFAPAAPASADADADLELATPSRSADVSAPPSTAPRETAAEDPSAVPTTRSEPTKAPKGAAKAAAAGESAAAAAELRAQIAKAVGNSAAAPQLEVRKTGEGLLISLTDKSDFAMFATGSAEPDRRLVLLMEKVSHILQSRLGKIIIRGHTDARPFRKGAYDNWRLSADRAQMAHYMLVRGGLDEKRIERIEGYADHLLKTPADPEGAQNRRIELLVREDKA